MQELFYTILAAWLIWRIFGAFSRSSERKAPGNFTQTNHNYYNTPSQGEVKVEQTTKSKSPKTPGDDDYVEFEEIK
jgi:hypothetical protein